MALLFAVAQNRGIDYFALRQFAMQEADRFGTTASTVELSDYWPNARVEELVEMWRFAQPPLRERHGPFDEKAARHRQRLHIPGAVWGEHGMLRVESPPEKPVRRLDLSL